MNHLNLFFIIAKKFRENKQLVNKNNYRIIRTHPNLDTTKIEEKEKNNRQRKRPGRRRNIRNETEGFIQEKNDISNSNEIKIVKSFKNNIFLRFLLLKNFKSRQDFIELFKYDINLNVSIESNQLVITSVNQHVTENLSKQEINAKITSYCNNYRFEIIDFEEKTEISDLLKKADCDENIFYEISLNSKLYLIGPNENMKNLLKNSNKITNTRIVTKSINLPKTQLNGAGLFNSLISLALKKLQLKYNLQSYELDVKNSKIDLTGLENKVEIVIDRLKHAFLSFKCERINELSDNPNFLTNSKNLNLIIQECLRANNSFQSLIYKIQILQIASSNEDESSSSNGIFLSYFYNCVDLDSKMNNVFSLIKEYLIENLIQIELHNDLTSLLISNEIKWKQFEQENFKKSKCLNNFSFVLNEKNIIYLTGIKRYVYSPKDSIEKFFSGNQLIDKKFLLDKHKVSF